MAVEDTREFGQRPKVDVYDSHLLIVFYTARTTAPTGRRSQPARGPHLPVGRLHPHRPPACDLLGVLPRALLPEGTETEDYLVYRVFDTLTDAYTP